MSTFEQTVTLKDLIAQLFVYQEHYKMIAIDLSKQQALDADSKAILQINYPGNLDEQQQFFSLLKKQKDQL